MEWPPAVRNTSYVWSLKCERGKIPAFSLTQTRYKMKTSYIRKPKNQVGRRRYNLWHQDPHCYYCKKELEWKESTIEHLYSKVKNGKYKGRREKTKDEVEIFTVLSCKVCNNEQQIKEHAELPRYKLWIRSRSFPNFLKKQLTLGERLIILWYQLVIDYKSERI
jgi:hypothetical protein